jgi:hypothetical protein
MTVVLYILLLVAVIVGVDVLFLKHHLRARLMANIAIAAVFAVVYYKYLKP